MLGKSILLLTAVIIATGSAQLYSSTRSCESEQICEYVYSVEQQSFNRNADDPITVSITVQLTCESSGTYGSRIATRYCMTVSDVDGNFLQLGHNASEPEDARAVMAMKHYMVQDYLSGWFCFVQSSEGQVVSVFHSQDEDTEAVNLKKSIAAAFQANFRGTEQEIEIDPQSKHVSHYRYANSMEGTTKMHRSISTEDVMEYPMHVPPRDVLLVKEEDVEYRDGKLAKSNGTTRVSFDKSNSSESREDPSGVNITGMFTFDGSFSMELRACRLIPHTTRTRREAVRRRLASDKSSEENLMARYDQTKQDIIKIIDIRKELGDVDSALLRAQSETLNDGRTFDLFEKAVELEYTYGSQNGLIPVVDYVLNSLNKLSGLLTEEAISKRTLIYSLLSAEGSHRSQQALIESFKVAVNDTETNALAVAIALVSEPNDWFIEEIEWEITRRGDSMSRLHLAYGALVSSAGSHMEVRMVSFLTDQLQEAENDDDTLIHLLHALGNTQSKLVIEHIVPFFDSRNEDVKITVITALRFFTDLSFVQNKIVHVLISNPSEAVISAVIESLSDGYKYHGNTEIHPDVVESLMNVTLAFGNQNLDDDLANYFLLVASEKTLGLLQILKQKNFKQKRASSTSWDSSNSDFNAIASHSSRRSDVLDYPLRRSYLWSEKFGKTSGDYQVYLQAAAGVFAGINFNLNFKVFGKAVLRAHALGYSYDAATLEFLYQKDARNIQKRFYSRIAGHVLGDLSENTPNFDSDLRSATSSPSSTSLASSRYRVFHYTLPIFIYVGTLDFGISFYLEMSGNLEYSLDMHGIGVRGSVAFVPTAGASVEGSVSLTLLQLARVGISLDATFRYQIGIESQATFCLNLNDVKIDKEMCNSIYDQLPGNILRFSAWYQTRRIRWCNGWPIDYPCGFDWGSRHTWAPLTFTWDLSSGSSRRYLYQSCSSPRAQC